MFGLVKFFNETPVSVLVPQWRNLSPLSPLFSGLPPAVVIDKLVSYLRAACDRSLKKEERAAVLVRVGLLVECHADLVKEQALMPLIVCNVMEAITVNLFSMRQADSIPSFYDKAPVTEALDVILVLAETMPPSDLKAEIWTYFKKNIVSLNPVNRFAALSLVGTVSASFILDDSILSRPLWSRIEALALDPCPLVLHILPTLALHWRQNPRIMQKCQNHLAFFLTLLQSWITCPTDPRFIGSGIPFDLVGGRALKAVLEMYSAADTIKQNLPNIMTALQKLITNQRYKPTHVLPAVESLGIVASAVEGAFDPYLPDVMKIVNSFLTATSLESRSAAMAAVICISKSSSLNQFRPFVSLVLPAAVAGAKATDGTYKVRCLFAMGIVRSYIGELSDNEIFSIGLLTLQILKHVPLGQSHDCCSQDTVEKLAALEAFTALMDAAPDSFFGTFFRSTCEILIKLLSAPCYGLKDYVAVAVVAMVVNDHLSLGQGLARSPQLRSPLKECIQDLLLGETISSASRDRLLPKFREAMIILDNATQAVHAASTTKLRCAAHTLHLSYALGQHRCDVRKH